MAEYIEREAVKHGMIRYGFTAPDMTVTEFVEDELPAADVAPVRHGRWVWDDNGMDWGLGAWKCSEYHSKPETWWETIKGSPYWYAGSHYCPNCGAKMDGGVNRVDFDTVKNGGVNDGKA